jgi:hypothetical protein
MRYKKWGKEISSVERKFNGRSLYWRLYYSRLRLIFVVLLSWAPLLDGCGGSDGSGDDPQESYYDQLWDVAKKSITPGMTDAEIAETLARWIVSNSTNAQWVPEDSTYPLPEGARGSDDALLPFHGLCGGRSRLFENLGQRAGLKVSVFNIYNFSSPGHGHTCVQVFYEDDWHFYDVTYAGMFIANGEVLSFAEMRADPISALAGMVVFEPTGDIRDYYSSGLPVDNKERMQEIYTEEALVNAISTSFLGSGNLVLLKVLFDLSNLPISVGDLAGTYSDLDTDGSNQYISNCLGTMLGYVWDNFEPVITLRNAVPGQAYSIRFFIYHSTEPGLLFRVSSTNSVDIISGSKLTTSSEMLWPETSVPWEITFCAEAEEASFTIHHDCDEGHGLYLNYIAVEVAD